MQNLRDQLLKAGLITEQQRAKAEADSARDDRSKKGKRDPREGGRDRPKKEAKPQPQPPPPPAEEPANKEHARPKISKKALMKQPVNRMLDLSDPNMLKIFQAIEEHRVREETKGDIPFHFTLRDGHVRKIFVKKQIFEGLESGRLAIVESGEQNRHVIVQAEAVAPIREVDPEAVRFANG